MASHCQAVTSLVSRELRRQGLTLLNYIDDFFGGVALSKSSADSHFSQLQALLARLGLHEATHKCSPPSQVMVWLGFKFDSTDMTVTLPSDKLAKILDLVQSWLNKVTAYIHDLRSLLGKLLYIAQCCPSARLFANRMLETLLACPLQGSITLSSGFRKDLAWFRHFLSSFNGIQLIHEDTRVPLPLYVDACTSGCRAVTTSEAYHTRFPHPIVQQDSSICHLEVLNAVVAVKICAPMFKNQLVHLFPDNTTAMAIFPA